jgi:WD40 repeat protein
LLLILSDDGKTLAINSTDGRCQIVDLQNGKPIFSIQSPNKIFQTAISSNQEVLVITDNSENIWVYNTKTNNNLYNIKGASQVARLAISPNNKYLAYTFGVGGISIVDLYSGKPIFKYKHPAGGVFNLEFSPDSRYLLSQGNEIKVISLFPLAD